jgi:hypothetical protein
VYLVTVSVCGKKKINCGVCRRVKRLWTLAHVGDIKNSRRIAQLSAPSNMPFQCLLSALCDF